MLRFALYGFALLVEKGAVACHGLLCSWEREAVTCYDLLCIALLRFALLCVALHCTALLVCGMTRPNQKHAIRNATSEPKAR